MGKASIPPNLPSTCAGGEDTVVRTNSLKQARSNKYCNSNFCWICFLSYTYTEVAVIDRLRRGAQADPPQALLHSCRRSALGGGSKTVTYSSSYGGLRLMDLIEQHLGVRERYKWFATTPCFGH